MKRTLDELTLKEYDDYLTYLTDETPDIISILELFGYEDVENMKIDEYNKVKDSILKQQITVQKVKLKYKIAGKSFSCDLNLTKLTAGQFIDFESYMKNKKLHEILSIFLVPDKNMFIKGKYNTDYDITDIQKFLYNNMLMSDAKNLGDFFLKQSVDLLKVMKEQLSKTEMKMKKKMLKEQKKTLLQ